MRSRKRKEPETDPADQVEMVQSFLAARLRSMGVELHESAEEMEALANQIEEGKRNQRKESS